MAKKGTTSAESNYLKIGLLAFALVAFLGWRFFSGGFSVPKSAVLSSVAPVASPLPSAPVVPVVVPAAVSPVADALPRVSETPKMPPFEKYEFIDYLVETFRPRLSVSAYSPETGFLGNIDWYDNGELVERYSIHDLHMMGVAVIHRDYGADLVWRDKVFIVTSWKLPTHEPVAAVATDKPLKLAIK